MEYGSALSDELKNHPNEPESTSDEDEEEVKEKMAKTIRLLVEHDIYLSGLNEVWSVQTWTVSPVEYVTLVRHARISVNSRVTSFSEE